MHYVHFVKYDVTVSFDDAVSDTIRRRGGDRGIFTEEGVDTVAYFGGNHGFRVWKSLKLKKVYFLGAFKTQLSVTRNGSNVNWPLRQKRTINRHSSFIYEFLASTSLEITHEKKMYEYYRGEKRMGHFTSSFSFNKHNQNTFLALKHWNIEALKHGHRHHITPHQDIQLRVPISHLIYW